MKMRRKLLSRKGETLIETLCSMLLLSLISAAMGAMLMAAVRVNEVTDETDTKLYAAVNMMENEMNKSGVPDSPVPSKPSVPDSPEPEPGGSGDSGDPEDQEEKKAVWKDCNITIKMGKTATSFNDAYKQELPMKYCKDNRMGKLVIFKKS